MNLHHLLNARAAAGKPVRVALIGAGKFGSMFLAQVPHTPGLEVPLIIDIDRDRLGAAAAARRPGAGVQRSGARPAAHRGAAAARAGDDTVGLVSRTRCNALALLRRAGNCYMGCGSR